MFGYIKCGDVTFWRERFAWFPTYMDDGECLWLKPYLKRYVYSVRNRATKAGPMVRGGWDAQRRKV